MGLPPAIEIHAPAIIRTPEMNFRSIMVCDNKGILINASMATRAGISENKDIYTIWFDDGLKRHYIDKIFDSVPEAETFLRSIYDIRE